MKGILESLEQFLMVAAALVLAFILLSLVFRLWPTPETGIKGDQKEASKLLADKAFQCFKKHRFGADPESEVCFTYTLETEEPVREEDVTRYLDCEQIPNNDCPGCGECTSESLTDQNKLVYKVNREKTFIKISYSGSSRRVEIRQFGCFFDQDCRDNNTCTLDSCLSPGKKTSRCMNRLNCTLCQSGAGEEGSDWCELCSVKTEHGLCDDQIDNDCDGKTDAEDQDCV